MSTYRFEGTPTNTQRRVIAVGTKGKAKDLQAFVGPCVLVSVTFRNLSTDQREPQVHDSASTPLDGTAPDMVPLPVAPGDPYSFATTQAREFRNGIYVCSSTTPDTKTLTGAADAIIEVEFYEGTA